LAAWCAAHADDTAEFEKQRRRKVHYVVEPAHLWSSIAELARTQSDKRLLTLR
jgi:type I restriction enzyme M protein